MPTPFAALESRVNAAVMRRLSNREAAYVPVAGGAPRMVLGIFEAQYGTDLERMAGDIFPAFTCKSADVADVSRGATLLIDATSYEVVEPMPDGAGFTVLRLRLV